ARRSDHPPRRPVHPWGWPAYIGLTAGQAAATGRTDAERPGAMEKRWYIVHAYSNFERKVAEAIKDRAKAAGLSDLFEEVLVPTEDVVEVRRGRKVQAERKFFPGYVLVKMAMTDAAYHLIPITEDEARRILYQVKEGVERPKPMISFEIGEKVRVADGPFASFEGQVEE